MISNRLELWQNWRRLVNVQPEEIAALANTSDGQKAIFLARSIEEEGYPSWRKSARALPGMISLGRASFDAALHGWAGEVYSGVPFWNWAALQVNQIQNRLTQGQLDPVQLAILKMWGHSLNTTPNVSHSQHSPKFTRADGLYFYRGQQVAWEDPQTGRPASGVFIYAVIPQEVVSNNDILALVQSNTGHQWVAVDWLRPALAFNNQTVGIHMPCLPKDKEGQGRNYCVYKEKPEYRGQAAPKLIEDRQKRIMKTQPKGFPKHTSNAKEAKHLIKMMKTFGKGKTK